MTERISTTCEDCQAEVWWEFKPGPIPYDPSDGTRGPIIVDEDICPCLETDTDKYWEHFEEASAHAAQYEPDWEAGR